MLPNVLHENVIRLHLTQSFFDIHRYYYQIIIAINIIFLSRNTLIVVYFLSNDKINVIVIVLWTIYR